MAKNNILIRSKLNKARSLLKENKLNEAREIYQQIYNSNKANHDIALEFAVVNRKSGLFNEASNICKSVLAAAPNNALAHHIHGSALQCLGDMEGAIAEYKTAIQLNNKLTEAHYFLGNIYRLVGSLELAAESFENAIKLNPEFFEALNNYGAVLTLLHRPVDARKALMDALRINPDSNQVLCNIAGYYLLENDLDEAFYYANKVYVAAPAFFDCLKVLGKIHFQKTQYDKALGFYRQALSISEDIEIVASMAQIFERRSEFDAAYDLIQPFVDTGKANPDILVIYSALSRKYNTRKMAIERMEQEITRGDVNVASKIILYTELGKQYDAIEEYGKAFFHYKQANQLERELNKQIQQLAELSSLDKVKNNAADTWLKSYPKSFWESLPTSGNSSSRPIFVVGMLRSGTTLAEQILASHPDIYGAGELRDINNLSFNIDGINIRDKSPASFSDVTPKQISDAANKYLATLDQYSKAAKRVVDKAPTNYFHLGLISLMFPNARIIHMIRDPRDVCLSMFFQRFSAQMTFSTDLVELADYYMEYQRTMNYWRQVLDIPILDVVYEELVENQEAKTREMIKFCGLEWNHQCLRFHETNRDISTPSYDQVREPMYKKSVARWKNYAEELRPLIERLGLDP